MDFDSVMRKAEDVLKKGEDYFRDNPEEIMWLLQIKNQPYQQKFFSKIFLSASCFCMHLTVIIAIVDKSIHIRSISIPSGSKSRLLFLCLETVQHHHSQIGRKQDLRQ